VNASPYPYPAKTHRWERATEAEVTLPESRSFFVEHKFHERHAAPFGRLAV
jgi:hypothetical protein